MAWEWVAPVATAVAGMTGVFFTWLAGGQSRRHAEMLARRQEIVANRNRVYQERREAYLSALRAIDVELRLARYMRDGLQEKLEELEKKWPEAERMRMSNEAVTSVGAFGSRVAAQSASRWFEAVMSGDLERMRNVYHEIVDLARDELASFGTERQNDWKP